MDIVTFHRRYVTGQPARPSLRLAAISKRMMVRQVPERLSSWPQLSKEVVEMAHIEGAGAQTTGMRF
jgi:hypothetical protein